MKTNFQKNIVDFLILIFENLLTIRLMNLIHDHPEYVKTLGLVEIIAWTRAGQNPSEDSHS